MVLDDIPVDGSGVRVCNPDRFNGVGGEPASELYCFFVEARRKGFPVSVKEVLSVENGHGFNGRRHFLSFVDVDVSCEVAEVVRFYRERVNGFTVKELRSSIGFSTGVFYSALNGFLDGRDLHDAGVTPRSFGFTGDGEFDVFVAERVEHRSVFVCAAVGLYVSGKLI